MRFDWKDWIADFVHFVLVIFCFKEFPDLLWQCKLFLVDNDYFSGILGPVCVQMVVFAYCNNAVVC